MDKEIKDGVIIKAKLIRATKDSFYLDCEGDPVWMPKKEVNLNTSSESVELPKWLHKKVFPNEPV